MIVLKDKKDIKFAPENFLDNFKWESHGQYDSLDFVDPDVEVLSIQFTKVGEKTYKAMPNLKWIVVRTHGFDNVNLSECEKRGIGVLTTRQFTQSTADWISEKIDDKDNVMFLGYGSIAEKVKAKNAHIINRSIRKQDLIKQLDNVNCLVVSMTPEGNDNFVDEDILKNFKGKIISVSRANVIDNTALYNNLDNISHAYIDTLDSKYREELLESGKVTYTKHTAWSHNFSYEDNQEYYSKLQIRILNPEAYKPVLPRTERVTF